MTHSSNTDPAAALRSAAREADLARAMAGFAEEAEHAGLLDVAYASVDSPLGEVLVARTPRGVVRVNLPNHDPDWWLTTLAEQVSPRVLEAPGKLDDARRQLEAYFEGRLREFDLPLDWQLSHGFYRRALRAIARIPYGLTSSYTEIAAEAGNPRAYRAAGTACGSNPIPIVVPCHRVLRAGGEIGDYGGGPEMKRFLLELEGALPEG
jgi:methylated-DNA-[protein]-cysteine S-methyltransferase